MVQSIKMPQLDSNNNTATITKIYCKDGDFVKLGTILFDIENSKTTGSIESEFEGYINLQCSEFEEYEIGKILCHISDSLECNKEEDLDKNKEIKVLASEKALNKAKELNIDINLIQKDGIIKENDVVNFFNTGKKEAPKLTNVFKYDRERVVIIGAGMGADVVVDIMLEDSDKTIIGLVDDKVKNYDYITAPILNCTIENFPEIIDRNLFDTAIISIVSNASSLSFREKIFNNYKNMDIKFTNAIPKYNMDIRKFVTIGEGNLICSSVYVGTGTTIGNNNFISYGCKIGHHNLIGNHNLIAPAVITSGAVTIGNKCVLAAGVTCMNRLSIGNRVILPVGFNVIKNYEDDIVIK